MFQKAFQLLLVAFVVLLTSAGLVLLVSGLITTLRPLHTDSIVAVAGGGSLSIIAFVVMLALILAVAAIYLFARPRLR